MSNNFMGLGFSFYGEDAGAIDTTYRLQSGIDGVTGSLGSMGMESATTSRYTNSMMDTFSSRMDVATSKMETLRQKLRDMDLGRHAMQMASFLNPLNVTSLSGPLSDLFDKLNNTGSGATGMALKFDTARFQMEAALGTTNEEFLKVKDSMASTVNFTGMAGDRVMDLARSLQAAGIHTEELTDQGRDGVLKFGAAWGDVLGMSNEEIVHFVENAEHMFGGVEGMEAMLATGIRMQKDFQVEGLLERIPHLASQSREMAMRMGSGFHTAAAQMVRGSSQIAMAIKKNIGGTMEEALGVTESFTGGLVNMASQVRMAYGGLGDFGQFNDMVDLLYQGGFRGDAMQLLKEAPKRQAEIAKFMANALQGASVNMKDRVFGLISQQFDPKFAAALEQDPTAFIKGLEKAQKSGKDAGKTSEDQTARSAKGFMDTAYKSREAILGVTQANAELTRAFGVLDKQLGGMEAGLTLANTGFEKAQKTLSNVNKALTGIETKGGVLKPLFGSAAGDPKAFLGSLSKGFDAATHALGRIHPAFLGMVPAVGVVVSLLKVLAGGGGVGGGLLGGMASLMTAALGIVGSLTGAVFGLMGAFIGLYFRLRMARSVMGLLGGTAQASIFGLRSFASGLAKYLFLPLGIIISLGVAAIKTMKELFGVLTDENLVGAERTQAIAMAIATGLYTGLNFFFMGLPNYLYEVFSGQLIQKRIQDGGVSWAKSLGKGIGYGLVLVVGPILLAWLAGWLVSMGIMIAGALGALPFLAIAAGLAFVLALGGVLGPGMQNIAFEIVGVFKGLGEGIILGMTDAIAILTELYTGDTVNREAWQANVKLSLLNIRQLFYYVFSSISDFVMKTVTWLRMGLSDMGFGVKVMMVEIGAAMTNVSHSIYRAIAKILEALDPFLARVQDIASFVGANKMAMGIQNIRSNLKKAADGTKLLTDIDPAAGTKELLQGASLARKKLANEQWAREAATKLTLSEQTQEMEKLRLKSSAFGLTPAPAPVKQQPKTGSSSAQSLLKTATDAAKKAMSGVQMPDTGKLDIGAMTDSVANKSEGMANAVREAVASGVAKGKDLLGRIDVSIDNKLSFDSAELRRLIKVASEDARVRKRGVAGSR